ncbi:hypothetical protein [Rhodobacter lacus]|uniref:Uncharacterized protein n=1 Tax=Rhodobacter lacus TaxID=1641972 RepID=A0ABW5ADH1_9RHOB
MKVFTLNAAILAAVSNAITPDETRYYLNGVYVEPVTDPETGKGVRFVATDGHILIAGYDPLSEATHPAILSMNFAAKALKPAKKDPEPRYLRAKIEKPETLTNGCVIAGPESDFMLDGIPLHEVDGTFPAYHRVIPAFLPKRKPGQKEPIYSFNPIFMAKFAKAFARVSDADTTSLILMQECQGAPMAVTALGVSNLIGVLMPRTGTPGDRPDWLDFTNTPSEQEKAA